MSEEQRRPVGAKARPLWGFAHKGTAAVLPGLAVEWLRRCAGRLAFAPLWTETRSARIDQGFPSKEIADRLFISIHTVNTHLKRIYRKLDVSSRRQAVEQAARSGLIDRR